MLFKQLRDSGREAIKLVDDDTLRYRQPVDGEAPDFTLPRWVLLNPDPVANSTESTCSMALSMVSLGQPT